MPRPAIFVDTNVLVYRFDTEEKTKHEAALKWVNSLWNSGGGYLSYQVLNEFYNTLRGKRFRCSATLAQRIVEEYFEWSPIELEARLIRRAWQIEVENSISWWDALIVAAAGRAGCRYLLSEDLSHGQRYGDIEVISPFRTGPGDVK